MTFCEAFYTNEKYKKCSRVNVINIIFHELTGINVIMIYSNTLLTNILGTDGKITPRLGTIFIGGMSFLSAILSIWTIKWWGRRPLLLVGHTGIAISHLLIGIFIIY